ncbi:MAG: hypothetical protein JO114_09020, partial [Planctomycetaceae bacterium]|nr:hypothetical protein [Planctomycetaceae bacterium]
GSPPVFTVDLTYTLPGKKFGLEMTINGHVTSQPVGVTIGNLLHGTAVVSSSRRGRRSHSTRPR